MSCVEVPQFDPCSKRQRLHQSDNPSVSSVPAAFPARVRNASAPAVAGRRSVSSPYSFVSTRVVAAPAPPCCDVATTVAPSKASAIATMPGNPRRAALPGYADARTFAPSTRRHPGVTETRNKRAFVRFPPIPPCAMVVQAGSASLGWANKPARGRAKLSRKRAVYRGRRGSRAPGAARAARCGSRVL